VVIQASQASAQWAGWPITNSWYLVTNNPIAQLYTAIVERANISAIAAPSSSILQTGTLSYVTNILPIARAIDDLYSYGTWLNPDYIDTNDTYDTHLATNGTLPKLTLSNVASKRFGCPYPWTIWPKTPSYVLAETVDTGASIASKYYSAIPAGASANSGAYVCYVDAMPFQIEYNGGTWLGVTVTVYAVVDGYTASDYQTNFPVVITGQITRTTFSNVYQITALYVSGSDLGATGAFLSFIIPTTGVCRATTYGLRPPATVSPLTDLDYHRLYPTLLEEAREYLTNLVWRKEAGTVISGKMQYYSHGNNMDMHIAMYRAETNWPVSTAFITAACYSQLSTVNWNIGPYDAYFYGGGKSALFDTHTNAYAPAVKVYLSLTNVNLGLGSGSGFSDQFSTFGWFDSKYNDFKYHFYTSAVWTAAFGYSSSNLLFETTNAPSEWNSDTNRWAGIWYLHRGFKISPVAVLHYTNTFLFQ
jgi:hypothetical protein